MSAEKTPCISAIDTTNFARQIVLDFEFAPVPKQRQRRGLRNEIIEVGAVKLDYHGNVMGEFSQFVQTEFAEGVAFPVRELTGISAVDTAMADPLYVVIKRLSDWIGRYSAQVVCWSGADRRQLLTECQAKHIDLSAFPTDWADLQAFTPRSWTWAATGVSRWATRQHGLASSSTSRRGTPTALWPMRA